jgi:CubicO group peptidase (beta-lactamase class C family)
MHNTAWIEGVIVATIIGCSGGGASSSQSGPGQGDPPASPSPQDGVDGGAGEASAPRPGDDAGAGPDGRADAPPPACATDLTAALAELRVPGLSASIVKNGRVVCTAVAGTAAVAKDGNPATPVTPETDFLWASVSKTVTATAVMQLWEQGKFQLDDDINRYLGFSVHVPSCTGTPITFRHLLTHTSSITDNNDVIDSKPVAVESGDPTVPLGDLVKGYLTTGGAFYHRDTNFDAGCPGTISDYSNMGVATLGYLVQVISGEDLYQYYRDHIFGPLGMANSGFRLADIDVARLAAPNGNEASYGEADFPDGMMRTSPAQLGKFLAMYTQGGTYGGQQILKSSTVEEMLKSQTSLGSASTGGITQGLVWYTVSTFGMTTWGHDGDDDGATSNMFFDPATKIGVILVSNGVWKGDPGAVATMTKLFQEGATY